MSQTKQSLAIGVVPNFGSSDYYIRDIVDITDLNQRLK